MVLVAISILVASLSVGDGAEASDVRSLIDTIESVQLPIEDFRCEFEGATYHKGKVAEDTKAGPDGLFDTFNGIYIWKRGGDTHNESLHRSAVETRIVRHNLVIRSREQQAEQFLRDDNSPLGYSVIKKPKDTRFWAEGPGQIFLIDFLKMVAADDAYETTVSDGEIEGLPLKVLSIVRKGAPATSSLISQYWIDLRRNGHVVRQQSYASGKVLSGRLDVKLAPFKVSGTEVWMPVSGQSLGYMALVDKKPVRTKEPTSIQNIYVVGGSMEFNKRPGPEVFTIKYKPGTPISDNLRKLQYEFGQQQLGPNPNKSEVQKMLNGLVANAEEQKAELVVASQSESFNWTSLIAWGFVVVVVVSSALLWIQRRRH